ncbi:hypothetical protein QJS66_15800 [Kocuria rhizophila]|nr:hypothetical protein QJS66_15800 [Kocuria rhizophila]
MKVAAMTAGTSWTRWRAGPGDRPGTGRTWSRPTPRVVVGAHAAGARRDAADRGLPARRRWARCWRGPFRADHRAGRLTTAQAASTRGAWPAHTPQDRRRARCVGGARWGSDGSRAHPAAARATHPAATCTSSWSPRGRTASDRIPRGGRPHVRAAELVHRRNFYGHLAV